MRATIGMTARLAVGLTALVLAATACGDPEPTATTATAPTTSTSTTTATAPTTSTSTTAPPTAPTTTPATTPTTSAPPPTAPATSQLGPEWLQQDGKVRIEAVAADDPQRLLADLVALGLTDGVVVGRIVNGWLPVESFDDVQRLASLKFVQPTGAGTGAGTG